MKKKEMRETEINYCDFCTVETAHTVQCGVCKKEGCHKDGLAGHFAFNLEIYDYASGKRTLTHICKECSQKTIPDTSTIGILFYTIMSNQPVTVKP